MVNAPRSTAGIRGQRTQMFWRMETSSGRVITCALYRMPNGFELRADEGEEDRWLAQRVSTVWAAEVFAATWKIAAQTNGVRGPVIGRSAVDLAGPSEQVQQMEDPPFVCPSCLSSRGRVQHVTTPPKRPDTLLFSMRCDVCSHTWPLARKPRVLTTTVVGDSPARFRARLND